MDANQTLSVLGAAVLSGMLVLVLTPVVRRAAQRFGILDRPSGTPGGYKTQRDPVPYLGGLAIFVGVAIAFILLAGLAQESEIERYLWIVLIAGALVLVGAIDDAKNIPPLFRFLAQFSAALGAWQAGFQVQVFAETLPNVLLTTLWIVGITNAFNLLDNMDGLSSGLAGVSATGFAAMGLLEALPITSLLAASVAGAAFGFLRYNRHPASIFMGDSGSLFLGFILAIVGLDLRFDNLLQVTFLVPVVALGLPILDTTLVIVSRARNKRGVFEGGRDHISHRLVRIGLPIRSTVRLLYWSAICLVWLGLVVSRATPDIGAMLLGFVVALGIFFGVLLLRVPVYAEESNEVTALEAAQDYSKSEFLEPMSDDEQRSEAFDRR